MAASTADAFGGARLARGLRGSLRRLGGVLLIAVAVALAVALFGFDWRDPSLNQATAHAVHNPAGLAAPTPPTCSTSCSASPPGCRCWSA